MDEMRGNFQSPLLLSFFILARRHLCPCPVFKFCVTKKKDRLTCKAETPPNLIKQHESPPAFHWRKENDSSTSTHISKSSAIHQPWALRKHNVTASTAFEEKP